LPFFSMVDRRRRLHRAVIDELRASRTDLLSAAIPASAEVERMGLQGESLSAFAPRGHAALAYAALWDEVRARAGAADSSRRPL
jgi:chromosome partitioning protein